MSVSSGSQWCLHASNYTLPWPPKTEAAFEWQFFLPELCVVILFSNNLLLAWLLLSSISATTDYGHPWPNEGKNHGYLKCLGQMCQTNMLWLQLKFLDCSVGYLLILHPSSVYATTLKSQAVIIQFSSHQAVIIVINLVYSKIHFISWLCTKQSWAVMFAFLFNNDKQEKGQSITM